MKKIIVIVGPTAVGKTHLSIQLAKELDGEIINGDSMQVYKHLNIGTAKITEQEAEGIPHHLLDICNLEEEYTASDFKKAAHQAIEEICERGHLPILVGGTGLYIEGLLFDFHYSGETSNDPVFRHQKEKELREKGSEPLWEELFRLDPKAAQAIHPNNGRRIVRALEVIHASGKCFSDHDHQQKTPQYDAFIIGLNTERRLLYDRINSRVDIMQEMGLEAEARMLYEKQFPLSNQAIRGIGYKEWFPYFEGEVSPQEVLELIQKNSRHYAKRQLTWFRNRLEGVHWYDLVQYPFHYAGLLEEVKEFMK